MTWLRHCSSALLLALVVGCASKPPPEPEGKQPEALPAELAGGFAAAAADLRAGRFQQAGAALERLSKDYPERPGIWANLGIAYAEQGRDEDAARALQQALTLAPHHPVAGNRLAVLHREAGRFEDAHVLYRGVLSEHPDYAPAHLNLGILCDLYLADLPCARTHYQRYLQLVGEDAQVSNWLVDLERRLQENK